MNILAITWDWSAFDGFALTIGIVGILVVFLALLFLSVIYRIIPKIMQLNIKHTTKKTQPQTPSTDINVDFMSGEVNAAINCALHLYFNDLHDYESNVLTVNTKEIRRQSPWSDKHQFLNQISK